MKFSVLNGKFIKTKKTTISMLDKGYWFDFCVYSSLKVIQGEPYFLDYHVERIFDSAERIELKHGFSKTEISDWVKKLIKKNKTKDCLLRLVLIGDPDLEKKGAKLYILPITGLTYHKNQDYSEGIKVITYSGQRAVPEAKTKSLLLGFLAFRQAKKEGATEALMIDNDGFVREGTQTNFFAIKGDKLIIPPQTKCLEGITKKFILEAVKDEFQITEEDIPLDKIKMGDYDEFFISSTTRNVMPIRQIDDYQVKSIDQCKKISKLLKKYQDKRIT